MKERLLSQTKFALYLFPLILLTTYGVDVAAHDVSWFKENPILLHVVSAAIVVAGRFVDKISTLRTLEIVENAHNAGHHVRVEEQNILYKTQPSRVDLLKGVGLIKDSLTVAAGTAFPVAGVAWGVASFIAGGLNFRTAREIQSEIK